MRDQSCNLLAAVEGYDATVKDGGGNKVSTYPGTASRCQGGFMIYGKAVNVVAGAKKLLDCSVDWRDRQMHLVAMITSNGVPGTNEALVVPPVYDVNHLNTGDVPTKYKNLIHMNGLFLTGEGWDEASAVDSYPVARPYRKLSDGVPIVEEYQIYAKSSNGELWFANNSTQALTMSLVWQAMVTPPLGVRYTVP